MTAESDFNKTIQRRVHFGIPIYEKKMPAYDARKDAIIARAKAMRNADTGVRRSNLGGWHSSDLLGVSNDDPLHPLLVTLLQISTACIRDFEEDRTFNDIHMTGAWININERGNWNTPHEHLPCSWSGVFYLDAGTLDENAKEIGQDGRIMFFDPMPLGREWKRPPCISYTPDTGTMLLFPSFLTHMVAPYAGDTPRISLAFNLVVERSAKRGDNNPQQP